MFALQNLQFQNSEMPKLVNFNCGYPSVTLPSEPMRFSVPCVAPETSPSLSHILSFPQLASSQHELPNSQCFLQEVSHLLFQRGAVNQLSYSQDVNFKYIVVGNEVHPNYDVAPYILPAMINIQNAISSANLQTKVSTAIDATLLTNSYPPNNGVFITCHQII